MNRVEWPPKGRTSEKGNEAGEDADRWEEAKKDEKGEDEAGRRRRRKRIGVGAKND